MEAFKNFKVLGEALAPYCTLAMDSEGHMVSLVVRQDYRKWEQQRKQLEEQAIKVVGLMIIRNKDLTSILTRGELKAAVLAAKMAHGEGYKEQAQLAVKYVPVSDDNERVWGRWDKSSRQQVKDWLNSIRK